MRIAKPLLMITTPVGVFAGLYECVRLAGGLVIVMLAALATVVATIRREARPAAPAAEALAGAAESTVTNTPGVICKS